MGNIEKCSYVIGNIAPESLLSKPFAYDTDNLNDAPSAQSILGGSISTQYMRAKALASDGTTAMSATTTNSRVPPRHAVT